MPSWPKPWRPSRTGGPRSARWRKTSPGGSTARPVSPPPPAAERATRALFSGEVEGLGADEIAEVFSDVPSSEVAAEELAGDGKPLIDLLVETGLASSKGDARRSIEQGGVYVNNERAEDPSTTVSMEDAIEGRFVLLRKGKKRYHLVAVLR